jgi:hypothetical protein
MPRRTAPIAAAMMNLRCREWRQKRQNGVSPDVLKLVADVEFIERAHWS